MMGVNYLYNVTNINVEVGGCGTSNAPSFLKKSQIGRYNMSCSLNGSKFAAPILVKYKLSQINKQGIQLGRIITNIESS